MKVIYVNCVVKNYTEVDYRSYHRSYRRNFWTPYKPDFFQAFFFQLQKLSL